MEVLLNLSKCPAKQDSYLKAVIRQIGRLTRLEYSEAEERQLRAAEDFQENIDSNMLDYANAFTADSIDIVARFYGVNKRIENRLAFRRPDELLHPQKLLFTAFKTMKVRQRNGKTGRHPRSTEREKRL
jgi:hypothetical protein